MARDNDDLGKTKADGTEKTDGTYMTRGDLANYLVEEADLDSAPPQATQFSDTSGHDQISDFVQDKSGTVESMSEHGIVDGYSDGTVNPDDAITRAQVSKMTNLEYDLSDPGETTFPDADTIGDWADSYTEKGEESISGPAAEAALGGPSKDALNNALSGSKGDDLSFISRSSEHEGIGDYFTDGTGDDRSDLVSDLPYTDPNETTLDYTLGQALDASAKQGVVTPGPDEGIAAPFIPGSAVLSETEPDEDDFKNNDTEEA
jgi:hypothetical protein